MLERYDEEKAFTGFSFLSRQEFYARARTAVAVVATGEREKYSNIILKLGVVK
ncbi:MAG: RbsD/FucU domain-containing protein [Neglectibacter sp.]